MFTIPLPTPFLLEIGTSLIGGLAGFLRVGCTEIDEPLKNNHIRPFVKSPRASSLGDILDTGWDQLRLVEGADIQNIDWNFREWTTNLN
ncbi:hypothetical protein Tco_1424904, partial [Tanacetum coccineum]